MNINPMNSPFAKEELEALQRAAAMTTAAHERVRPTVLQSNRVLLPNLSTKKEPTVAKKNCAAARPRLMFICCLSLSIPAALKTPDIKLDKAPKRTRD